MTEKLYRFLNIAARSIYIVVNRLILLILSFYPLFMMVMIMAWLPIVMCNICIMQHFVPYLRSKSSEVSINSQYLFLMHLKDEELKLLFKETHPKQRTVCLIWTSQLLTSTGYLILSYLRISGLRFHFKVGYI